MGPVTSRYVTACLSNALTGSGKLATSDLISEGSPRCYPPTGAFPPISAPTLYGFPAYQFNFIFFSFTGLLTFPDRY